MIELYKYHNDEELETIKALLTLRKKNFVLFTDLVDKYCDKYNINTDDLMIYQFTKLYNDCIRENKEYLSDKYLLMSTRSLSLISNNIPTTIYYLNISAQVINNDLPF